MRKDTLGLPDPTLEPERFTTDSKQYGPRVAERLQQISGLIRLVNEAQVHLESVRPLRERENSPRWRANYDLMVAQLWWYKLRLFEYGLALDQFVRQDLPQRLAENPKHNRWQLREAPTGEMVLPNTRQTALLGVTAEELQLAHDRGLELLREVEQNHPDSPWSRRAVWERERGFGISLQTYYQPPPRPPSGKPERKPTPPPNL